MSQERWALLVAFPKSELQIGDALALGLEIYSPFYASALAICRSMFFRPPWIRVRRRKRQRRGLVINRRVSAIASTAIDPALATTHVAGPKATIEHMVSRKIVAWRRNAYDW